MASRAPSRTPPPPLLLLLLLLAAAPASAAPGLCEVETGQSNIILDIEESRDVGMGQSTTPPELPVVGDPFSEVALDLSFPRAPSLFLLNGKRLQLLRPLDRDVDNLSHLVFQLTCTVRATNKKRTIPVIVRVSDINDNAPEFIGVPYSVQVSELTPVGSTVFSGLRARDADAGVNGLVEYFLVEGSAADANVNTASVSDANATAATVASDPRLTTADGFGLFIIPLPHQGQVTLARALDYERTQRYLLTIVASDNVDSLACDLCKENPTEGAHRYKNCNKVIHILPQCSVALHNKEG